MMKAQAGVRLQGREPGEAATELGTDLEVAGALGPEPQLTLRNVMRAAGDKSNSSLGKWQKMRSSKRATGRWLLILLLGSSMGKLLFA